MAYDIGCGNMIQALAALRAGTIYENEVAILLQDRISAHVNLVVAALAVKE